MVQNTESSSKICGPEYWSVTFMPCDSSQNINLSVSRDTDFSWKTVNNYITYQIALFSGLNKLII